jgi:hypothetical protein
MLTQPVGKASGSHHDSKLLWSLSEGACTKETGGRPTRSTSGDAPSLFQPNPAAMDSWIGSAQLLSKPNGIWKNEVRVRERLKKSIILYSYVADSPYLLRKH